MKNYVKPEAYEEKFIANDFVSKCTPGTVTWTIKCDVPNGTGWQDKNNNGVMDSGEYLASGSGCNKEHVTELPVGESPSKNAKWTYWSGRQQVTVDVFYFKDANGNKNNNHHFSLSALEGDATSGGQMS